MSALLEYFGRLDMTGVLLRMNPPKITEAWPRENHGSNVFSRLVLFVCLFNRNRLVLQVIKKKKKKKNKQIYNRTVN